MKHILICQNKQELIKNKKNNARLFPIYKMFSWDLLFYYAIAFVFLTQTKGLSLAAIMFTDSLYPIFKCILQIPADMITDRLGKRKALMLANFFLFLAVLILIVSNGIASVLLSYLIQSVGFAIKNVAESNLLYDSVTVKNGHDMYTKLDEKGSSNYYYLDGITSLLTGFLFVINGYIPMLICLMFTVISIALASCFKDIYRTEQADDLPSRLQHYKEDVVTSSRFIFHSNRLKALIVFMIFFSGLLYSSYSLREGLLTDLGVPAQYFGIILAVLTFLAGIATSHADKIQRVLKNKTLSAFSIFWVISFILIGLITMMNLNSFLQIGLILFIFVLHYCVHGPYYTLYSRYQKSFATPGMRLKIASTLNIIQSLAEGLIAFIISLLLEVVDVRITFLLIGTVSTVMLFRILTYMKPRFGLQPEQYTKEDIETLESIAE